MSRPRESAAHGELVTQERDDAGSMTVVVAALVAIVMSLTIGVMAVASAAEESRRAGLAADLAALAGAVSLRDSGDPVVACAEATRTALANGARLTDCSTRAGSFVSVRCATRSLLPFPGAARVAERSSRAGPDPTG